MRGDNVSVTRYAESMKLDEVASNDREDDKEGRQPQKALIEKELH